MHSSPDDFCVDPKIFVCQFVSHAGNLTPGNVWVIFLNAFRNLAGCFSNDFKSANDCVNGFIVYFKLILVHAFYKRKRLFGVFQHVTQIIVVDTFHTGMASFKMTFPIAGLSESFITKSTLTPNSSDK